MTTLITGATVQNGYIELPITGTATQTLKNALTQIAAQFPGWTPKEGHIEVVMLEQMAAMTAQSGAVAAKMPVSAFTFYGSLVGIQPEVGAQATSQTTWTMVDAKGYTVPAGTLVGYQILGNNIKQFKTVDDFTIPAGTTQTDPGAIEIVSSTVGTTSNGFVAQTLTLITSLAFVQSVVSTTTTSGGSNPETVTHYIDRLSDELKLLAPRPILPPDFAEMAKNVDGVYRAVAFNGLNPYANLLVAEDATFVGGIGTWSAVSGCTVSDVTGPNGEKALQIAATGTVPAVAKTGKYSLSANTKGYALVSLDHVTTARNVTGKLINYDVNGTVISTITGQTVTESTAGGLTFLLIPFVTPSETFDVAIEVSVASPGSSEHHYIAYPGIITHQLDTAPNNHVPDSNLKQVSAAKTWTLTSGITVTPIFLTLQNAFTYTGTGSASGTKVAKSEFFYLAAGTYNLSAYIDARYVTSGNPGIRVVYGTTVAGTLTQTEGIEGVVSTTFTLATPHMVQFIFGTTNCTVQSGQALIWATPQILLGAIYSVYTPGPSWGPPNAIFNNERMVTVAAVDTTGNPLSTAIEAEVASYLESLREVNFVVNVIGPSYTSIDVTWTGFVTTANPNTVQNSANAALNHYLSPANWAGGTLTPAQWNPTQMIVRFLEVATIIGETPGLTLASLEIGYHNGTMGTTDLPLIGYAPLPQVGTITGVVTIGT